jgi:hypothetical protein
MKWAIVLCYFRHNSPAGPVVDSDDEQDDRDQQDLADLSELVDINQPDWLPAQPPPPPGLLTPLQQPVTPLPIPPPPLPPQPQPTQSVTMDEVFVNFHSV